MDQKQPSPHGEQKEDTKTPEEANENIRKSQGDDVTDPADAKKTGNRPAFDRDR